MTEGQPVLGWELQTPGDRLQTSQVVSCQCTKLFNSIFALCLPIFWLNLLLPVIGCECVIALHVVFFCPIIPGFLALLHNNTSTHYCLLRSLVKTCCGESNFLKPSLIALLLQTLTPFVWDQCLLYMSWKRVSRWPLLPRTRSVHFRWALMEERKKRKRWIQGRFHLLCLHLISLTAPLIFRCDWSV